MNNGQLTRALSIRQAVLLGLGSILGTGVFVSISLVAGIAGPMTLWAILVGAAIASCNGLSSAQLAANHPLSGGTYEYGYRWLSPLAGFIAGWTFLCAKSASAASAALGFSAYALDLLSQPQAPYKVPLACFIVGLITTLVCFGIRRSSQANTIIVTITLTALLSFVAVGSWHAALPDSSINISQFASFNLADFVNQEFLYACALMFVAYTGYGRIATMSEEVVYPRKTIPIAIITTLVLSALLYSAVGFVILTAHNSAASNSAALTLQAISNKLEPRFLPWLISIGAATAMLGVLLNLILGLSRVTLAMSRRNDLPAFLAQVTKQNSSPTASIITVGLAIGLLCTVGDLKATWSLSALTVLIYYAITNASALALRPQERLYPRWISCAGLVACLSLTAFIPATYWLLSLNLIAAGLLLRFLCNRVQRTNQGAT